VPGPSSSPPSKWIRTCTLSPPMSMPRLDHSIAGHSAVASQSRPPIHSLREGPWQVEKRLRRREGYEEIGVREIDDLELPWDGWGAGGGQ